MTLFMIFGIATFLAVISLLWCLRGFSLELDRHKPVRVLERPVVVERVVIKKHARKLIHMQLRNGVGRGRTSRRSTAS